MPIRSFSAGVLSGAVFALAACSQDQTALTELEASLAEARDALSEAEAASQAVQDDFSDLISEFSDNAEAAMATVAPRADARATVVNAEGKEVGEALLMNGPHGMVIRLVAPGLPTGFHGAHLHQVGDCSDPNEGFKKSGGHINLTGSQHGFLNPEGYHTGANFPNLWSGPQGMVTEVFADRLTLQAAMDEDGFAFIIHANEDDHVTQPIGGAGGRIACAAFN